jgi:hypothetical protein
MSSVHSTFPYELRIGVTGHRSVSGVTVEEAVRKLFVRIAETLSTPRTPLSIVVISPLAAGADRVVARVALERGARLEVIAPLPFDEYRKDFVEAIDRYEFDVLLEKASRITAPARDLEKPPIDPEEQRGLDYLHAGEHIVDASEILIAIWDGQPESGTGGTAQIIRYALETGRVVLWIHSNVPQLTPRWIRSPLPSLKVTEFPRGDQLSAGYSQQAEYCANAAVDASLLAESCRSLANRLSSGDAGSPSPFDTWQAGLASLLHEHARADMLAVFYERRHAWTVKSMSIVAAAGVSIALAQTLFLQEHPWIVAFEVVAMLVVLGLWWRSGKRAWHDRWLSNRYLAERFRSAIFISLANPKRDAEDQDSQEMLPFYEGPRQWLARVTAHMSRQAGANIGETPLEPLKNFIVSCWIDAQCQFHVDNADRKKRIARLGHRLGTVFFGATLVLASLHGFGVGHATRGLGKWITFLAIVLPVWAGAIHAITVQLELERIAERSRRMAHSLRQLRQRILRARAHAELQAIVKETAALIRSETHEWWVLLSFQDTRLRA